MHVSLTNCAVYKDRRFAFENLIVNHYAELLPHLHLDEALVYSAAPYRRGGPKGVGYQIDLLLQTKRSQCVVEIKRRNVIKKGIIDEVAAKVGRLTRVSPR